MTSLFFEKVVIVLMTSHGDSGLVIFGVVITKIGLVHFSLMTIPKLSLFQHKKDD